jgi:histidine triad (HIT) family protein
MHRIRETETLQAFDHPMPSYPVHIVIVPKQAIRSITALDASQTQLLGEVVVMVEELVKVFELEASGYRLVVNGGAYQEIPQLHFHLVSGSPSEKE